jgi:lysophospholipase L1-like esterase
MVGSAGSPCVQSAAGCNFPAPVTAPAVSATGFGGNITPPNLAQRAPGPSDDITQGHFVGEYWYTHPLGLTALSVTSGNTVWAPTGSDRVLPVDTLSGANGGTIPTGAVAVGMVKLRAAYTGPAIHIAKSASDPGVDISFLGNGKIDVNSIWAYNDGAPVAVMTGYDQTGNASNCTATSFANAPVIQFENQTGTTWGMALNAPSNGLSLNTPADQELVCPSAVTATQNAMTVAMSVRIPTLAGPIPLFEFNGSSSSFNVLVSNNGTVPNVVFAVGGFVSNIPLYANTTDFILATGPTGATMNVNGVSNFISNSIPSTSLTPLFIGAGKTNFAAGTPTVFGGAEFGSFISWPVATTTATQAALSASMGRLNQVPNQVHDAAVFDGDSLTFGLGSPLTLQTLGRKLERFAPSPMNVVNLGITGVTLATLMTNFTTRIPPLFPATARNKSLFLWAGTNDINAGTTGAAIFAMYQTYTSTIKGLVSGVQVYWVTCLPRGSDTTAQTAQKAILNADLRSGAAAAGAIVVDLAAIPALQTPTNTTYFFTDALHLTDNGYEAAMPAFGAALKLGLH